MPTYNQVKTAYESAVSDRKAAIDAVTRSVSLGYGYTFEVKPVNSGAQIAIKYALKGNPLNLNRVPREVIRMYYLNANDIDDWIAGTSANFPVLRQV